MAWRRWAISLCDGLAHCPHENQIRFIHTHIQANAAIVVSIETGKNKFRAWHDEKVTWLLGKDSGAWKLIGFFIRDIKNPE